MRVPENQDPMRGLMKEALEQVCWNGRWVEELGAGKSEYSAGWLGYCQVISCGFRKNTRVGFATRCLRGISELRRRWCCSRYQYAF
jgi:hypothetical protein